MLSMLRYVIEWTRDESGAEFPEWVIWVAVLAVVGAALLPVVNGGLAAAYTAVMAGIPGV
jgi:Flp pilus assembly pilin Flp